MAMGLSGLILAGIATTYLLSMRSFTSFQNTIALDSQSRLASDRISTEIRHANDILNHENNQITFAIGTNLVRFIFDPNAETLSRADAESTQVLLEDCKSVRYEFYERAMTNDAYGLLPINSHTNAHAVQMFWECSREILGKKVNVSEFMTPRVVMRRTLL